jgi:hypothetical protein
MRTFFVLLVISAANVADAGKGKKSPIMKIVQMLNDMQAKGKKREAR